MEFINMYTSSKKKATAFLYHHVPMTYSMMAGDFNTYQPAWYGV